MPLLPSPQLNSGDFVSLTVRLLSGELLVKLSVVDSTSANELRLKVLEGAQTLSDLGMRGQQEVVAVTSLAMNGDFEDPRSCVCEMCGGYAVQMRFEMSGKAYLTISNGRYFSSDYSKQVRAFRYTLGAVELESPDSPDSPDLRRSLVLEELPTDASVPDKNLGKFEGWLLLDAEDPIQRKVCVSGLAIREPLDFPHGSASEGLRLEDLAALRQRGEEGVEVRLERLFWYYKMILDERCKLFVTSEQIWDPRLWPAEMDIDRHIFARPRCAAQRRGRHRECRSRRPSGPSGPGPHDGGHGVNEVAMASPWRGRGCKSGCKSRHQGDVWAEAKRVQSATRRAERALKSAERDAAMPCVET